jgi:hypothetical protein
MLHLAKRMMRSPSRALRWARQKLVAPPVWSWRDVSDAAHALSDAAASVSIHEGLARIEPTNGLFAHRYALALSRMHRPIQAMEAFKHAVRLAPQDPGVWDGFMRVAAPLSDPDQLATLVRDLGAGPRLSPAVQRAVALGFLTVKRPDLAFQLGPAAFGPLCSGVADTTGFSGVYSLEIAFDAGRYTIRFAHNFLYWPFLVERVFALGPWLARYAAETRPQGVARLSIGDGPEGAVLQGCFSAPEGPYVLLPDSMFIESNAYAGYRADVESLSLPWSQRRAQAYWRGGLTGQADRHADIMRLPRVTLALLALHEPRLDAKLTDLSQFGPWLQTIHPILVGLGVMGDRENPIENLRYRYLVDIDGNTNSWPGLYMKLFAGGTVLKLKSEYRQWYYDRLIEGETHLDLENLEELPELLEWCERNPAKSERIGRAGAALARSLTVEGEYDAFARGMHELLR